MTPAAKKAYEAWRRVQTKARSIAGFTQAEADAFRMAGDFMAKRYPKHGDAMRTRLQEHAAGFVAGFLACHRATRRTGEKKARAKR